MKKKNTFIMFILLGIVCAGCSFDAENKLPEAEVTIPPDEKVTGTIDKNEQPAPIHVFTQEDINVIPSIEEYHFKNAQQIGTTQKMEGILPGSDEGTWYIIEIDGIEYYYGKYNGQETEETKLFGYSIVSSEYSFANGISVGMTKEEILSAYPDMAVIDFEDNPLEGEVSGCQGWNGISYPRSYVDMDCDWNYKGKDYNWTDQFEYAIIADIDLEETDAAPRYVALLMTGDTVAAITFYCPTAG